VRILLAVLLSITPLLSAAEPPYQEYTNEEVFNITSGAALQHPNVILLLKNSEQWGWAQIENMGVNEKYVRSLTTIAAPLVYGKASTQGIHYGFAPYRDATIRPDLEYYLWKHEYNVRLNFAWRF
jgi:hypothetical protein